MRLNGIFCLLILSFLLTSCAEETPAYRKMWQEAHHMDDAQMMALYGESAERIDNTFGLILEAVDGNWDRVKQLTEGSRISELDAYYHNLAMAMEGHLAMTSERASMLLL